MLKKAAATAVALTSLTTCAFASGEQGTVTANVLNVRSGPNTNSSIIAKLKKGTVINLLSKSGNWYKTKVNGKEGWVSGDYVKVTANSSGNTNTSTNTKKAKTTANSLNMRNGAGTSFSIIKKLPKGTEIDVISVSGSWAKMKHDGRLGYVHTDYIEYINTTPDAANPPVNVDSLPVLSTKEVVKTDSLNVRTGPSTKYTILGTLKEGQRVEVVAEENGWSKIKYGNKTAYASNSYLKVVTNANNVTANNGNANNGTVTEEKVIGKKTATTSVNVRSGAGTNHTVLGVLAYNEEVEVYSESNGWSKIKYKNGVGYVATSYLSAFINSSNIGTSSSDKVEGNVTYKALSYTLDSHIARQMERVEVGGNVISSSKPRMFADATVSKPQARGFIPAELDDIEYFLNPDNFVNSKRGMQQFLRIDEYREGITVSQLNAYLNGLPANDGKGGNVFYNQGQTFIDAAKKNNIDLTYLVAHAMWETGYGGSTLAKGQTITSYKGTPLAEPVTVYNFFGIGAIDKSANVSGAEASYSNGWTSIEKTIDGSAEWIAKNYIHNSKYNQNTIYKMKFNYDYTWHQYATDVNWANGISGIMATLNDMYANKSLLKYEVPSYSK